MLKSILSFKFQPNFWPFCSQMDTSSTDHILKASFRNSVFMATFIFIFFSKWKLFCPLCFEYHEFIKIFFFINLTSLFCVCSMYYILHDIITNWKDRGCLLSQIQRSCYIGMVLFCRLLSLCAIYNGSKPFLNDDSFIFLCNHVFRRFFFSIFVLLFHNISPKNGLEKEAEIYT